MATAILTRSERTVGIVERQEAHLRDDGTWQVRDSAGSGKWHTVIEGHCTCPDYVFRHMTCKHLRVVAAEERQLADYAANRDTRAEQARQTSVNSLPQVGPCCPDCSAPLDTCQYYTGGRGYRMWLVCTRDAQHQALPA